MVSTATSILDSIYILQGALTPLAPVPNGNAQSMAIDLKCQAGTRSLLLPSPLIVRNTSSRQLGPHWRSFCSLLCKQRLPVYSPVAELESLPTASIPLRFAQQFINEPLDPTEIHTADAFELIMRERATGRWGWSSEVGRNRLASFVSAVRCAIGGEVPIGVGLPMEAQRDDVQAALDAGVDFLTLEAGAGVFTRLHLQGLLLARRACKENRLDGLPIFVDLPLRSTDAVAKLIALGASCVAIDPLIETLLPKPTKSRGNVAMGSGMLSGIAVANQAEVAPLHDLEQMLGRQLLSVSQSMQRCGAARLSELDLSQLWTSDLDLQRMLSAHSG